MLLIHSAFVMFSSILYFAPELFVSFSFGCWYFFLPLPILLVEFFFRCFGMSCFICIVLSRLNNFLVFLLSPVTSGLIPRVVLSFLIVVFFYSSQLIRTFRLCLILSACCRFLICISNRIFHPGFEFLFVFFWGTPILSQIISLLH